MCEFPNKTNCSGLILSTQKTNNSISFFNLFNVLVLLDRGKNSVSKAFIFLNGKCKKLNYAKRNFYIKNNISVMRTHIDWLMRANYVICRHHISISISCLSILECMFNQFILFQCGLSSHFKFLQEVKIPKIIFCN